MDKPEKFVTSNMTAPKKRCLLSIIIPVYNSERYIADAIESLRVQSFRDFEIIVIDGGSIDRTLNILKSYLDDITVLVSEKDNGQSDALNKGLALANGEFVTWLNSDDLFMPNTLQNFSELIRINPTSQWFVFNTIIIDSEGYIIRFNKGLRWFEGFMKVPKMLHIDSPTSIMKTEIVTSLGGFNQSYDYVMDLDLWARLIKHGETYTRVSGYGYAFRHHYSSKTGTYGYKNKNYKENMLSKNSPRVVQSRKFEDSHNLHRPSVGYRFKIKLLKLLTTAIFDYYHNLFWTRSHISKYANKVKLLGR